MPRTAKLHQRNSAPWFRSRHLDFMLMQIRDGVASVDEYNFLHDLGEKGGATRVGVRSRCGRILPVERIAYNMDELDCERCLYLTGGADEEYVRPAEGELPARMHRL